jgi:succinate-semialdehyde dehydrogenase/glutarate-semialdehyde dehydrogenase
MDFRSVNPYTGELLAHYDAWGAGRVEEALARADAAFPGWAATGFDARARIVRAAAALLRERQESLARLMALEMGKRIVEARAEIEKCAWVCEYYAQHAQAQLSDQSVESDASRSLVCFAPMGPVLAVMPWNFPFWQVFRFAAPALMAGNVGLLKHASNVPQCALEIESLWRDAGAPAGVFQTLMIRAAQVGEVIADRRVRAVTLTGSEPAGRQVGAAAGAALKKSVLELGGSDAFIVLEDADLDLAAAQAVASRFQNGGQSCIAAKRFIVVESVAEAFVERLRAGVMALRPGDPLDAMTTLPPLARTDLRDELHAQVRAALDKGATALAGCAPLKPLAGGDTFYAASILDHVQPGMRPWDEELFGPVASVIRVRDEDEALAVANDSRVGLGGSVWTADAARGERIARALESGCGFVNGMVKSDPRLPFGGVKDSGYGRELSELGIREFVHARTLWVRSGTV